MSVFQTMSGSKLLCLMLVSMLSLSSAADVTAADQATVLTSLREHLGSLEYGTDVDRSAAIKLIDRAEADEAAVAVTEALATVFPRYADAIQAADRDESKNAIKQLAPLAEIDDRFLAADASFYLARIQMNDEQFESALPLLERLTGELADSSVHQAVAQYFIGVAQAGLLQNDAATKSLTSFLQNHPTAPERLRVSAWRKVEELQAIEQGKLDDVYQRMDFSRRRLEQIETGAATQEQQEKIVNLLGKLIKEAEKKECSSSCKNCKKSSKQSKPKNQQAKKKPQKKPSQSKTPGSSSNPNGKVVDKSYDDAPASPWSRLRDRSRDPANNAVKDKLPAKYRDIVEKYYEAANGGGKAE